MEEKIKNKRESNIELLRIICILLIIIHHIAIHGIKPQLENTNLFQPGQMFNNFVFYKRLIFLDFAASFGKIANNIFILISGYFLCEKVEFKLSKQLKKILGQVFFATLLLMIVSTLYAKFIDTSYTSVLSLTIFNDEWTFIGYYLCIIILGRIFINKAVQQLDQTKYAELLLSLFAIISLTFTRGVLFSISQHLVILVTGIFMYCLGGYIKKYDLFKNVKIFTILLIIVVTAIIMAISYKSATINNIKSTMQQGVPQYHQSISLYEEYRLPCIVLAVSTFELFRRMKIKNNSVINYLANATFMAFLMHDNEFIRTQFRKIAWIEPYHDNIKIFMGMVLVAMLATYAFGVASYFIYKISTKKINNS